MSILDRLTKLATTSKALREAHLRKEAGFATALGGLGKSIANKSLALGSSLGKSYGEQVARHGAVSATLGAGMGMSTAAGIPKALTGTYQNNKAGFNPLMHKARLGMES